MEKVDNKKELNTITLELLDRTNELKNSIMNSMVIGDSSIIEGIIIFEEVLMMINPTDIEISNNLSVLQFFLIAPAITLHFYSHIL